MLRLGEGIRTQGVAQEESETRSKSIKWGIIRKAEDGTSSLYKRKCYGYCAGENGELQINESEASVVKDVFDMYLQGKGIIGIKWELESRGIKSPTGNDAWCKRSIDVMLSNEKYSGDVIVFKTFNSGYPNSKRKDNGGEWNKFLSIASHPAIITKEVFLAVQEEKVRRSNIIKNDKGSSRKPTRHSSSKDNTQSTS